ncbi:hypothetical protein HELRODRAFT_104520 [Helobdella robusta]|uniref:SCP domain-containing protein n=1 Tax=Helobdella robusta TaxID=6412 RepID=T1EDL9_HELRO|nr:hypothetical protein HELRODRAFT_104520 [Helobdella robusta]ESN90023.1 hypothetical protein HELRODRAFT_104520 [Helobdella robusta]
MLFPSLLVLGWFLVVSSAEKEIIIVSPGKRAPLSDDVQSEIINAHNNFRKGEGSSNMKKIKWNSVLAEMADTWASSCSFTHGQPSSPSSPFPQTGQNLFATTVQAVNVSSYISSWYKEKEKFDSVTQTCAAKAVCGHYTQVVWAATSDVGCSYALCPTLPPTKLTNAYFFVCNYGPAGNFVGQKPFKIGSACADCSDACTDGLCN